MASRALGSSKQRIGTTNWNALIRRALRRSGELGGAVLLFAGMLFLAIALASYHQTDVSGSTAAGGAVQNWMGPAGAWVADAALTLFGMVAVLLLPLLYVFARKLWRFAEEEDGIVAPADQRWWRPMAVLLIAMFLLGTVLSLVFTQPGGSLPATSGGIAGLLGAKAIRSIAELLPTAAQVWVILAGALACLAGGAFLAGRVFAIDWAMLLTLPGALRRQSAGGESIHFAPSREKAARTPRAALVPMENPRKPPEITDPARAAKPAQLSAQSRQSDLFDSYKLPPLDLLAEPPPNSQPKIDKLSLERNARLLETVLDDFNVKGTIEAVRTGPVVTMYELEPAPGIKASRVIGLADDIARNMSAISARVSSIPGRTVMGIELPNANRQMVALRELVACEAFANSQGDAADHPRQGYRRRAGSCRPCHHAASAGRGHHRLGQIGRSELHPAVAALPADTRPVPPDPDRSQGARTQEL